MQAPLTMRMWARLVGTADSARVCESTHCSSDYWIDDVFAPASCDILLMCTYAVVGSRAHLCDLDMMM